jgi:hypothetical protein
MIYRLRSFIPTAILILDGSVLPEDACVGPGNNCALARNAQCPNVIGVYVEQVGFGIWITISQIR